MIATWWTRTWPGLLGATVVLTVATPAAVASYWHAREVVERHDPAMAPWLPLSVDGMLLAALVVMAVRRRRGVPVGRGPWAAFVFGVATTLGANLAAVDEPSVEAFAVHLLPPIVLAIALELVALVAGRAPAGVDFDTPSSADRAWTSPAPERVVLPPAPVAASRMQGAPVAGSGSEERFPSAGSADEASVSTAADRSAPGRPGRRPRPNDRRSTPVVDPAEVARLAAAGAGRRKAAEALGVSPYRAERLLAEARTAPAQPPGDERSTAAEGDRLAVNGAVRS